jgi:hypothetical protein
MCDAKAPAAGKRLTTESGVIYYPNTPEGQEAARADMAATMGPGAGEGQQPPPPKENPNPPEGCEDYTDALWDKPCSKYFKYAHMKYKPVANPEANLTASQVACNWQKTCKNILDPLVDAGFKLTISSGYRTPAFDKSLGAKNSVGDHPCGRAVDIQILGQGDPSEKAKDLFKYVGKNMSSVFSQLIYEGRWVHVAQGGSSPASVAVLVARSGSAPYQQVGGKAGTSLPPDLKWA